MFATSLALLAQAFQGHDRGVAFGLFGAITGIAVAVGPVLGGAITTDLSWRWIFYVNVPIGVVALAITLLRVDESRNPKATAARLGRIRHLQRRARRARVRTDPEPARRLGLDARDRVARRERGTAGRPSSSSSGPGRADARPRPAACADVRRRPVAAWAISACPVLAPHLPDHLHAEHARPLGGRDRRPLPAADRARSSSRPASPAG